MDRDIGTKLALELQHELNESTVYTLIVLLISTLVLSTVLSNAYVRTCSPWLRWTHLTAWTTMMFIGVFTVETSGATDIQRASPLVFLPLLAFFTFSEWVHEQVARDPAREQRDPMKPSVVRTGKAL